MAFQIRENNKLIKNLHKLLHDAFHYELSYTKSENSSTKTMDNRPMLKQLYRIGVKKKNNKKRIINDYS